MLLCKASTFWPSRSRLRQPLGDPGTPCQPGEEAGSNQIAKKYRGAIRIEVDESPAGL